MGRLKYWKRIIQSYLLNNVSQLDFWHGEPKKNFDTDINKLSQYYMLFHNKALYDGNLDSNGIPMLNYHGHIGLQYNPIAISQWGLGNYNLWIKNKQKENYNKFIACSEWLVDNLVENEHGLWVWMHEFDWEYKETLKSPWYSGLAQGQGLSVIVRAWEETRDNKYRIACDRVYKSFETNITDGGVMYLDEKNQKWIEEYILDEPTHILNGFIWSIWGVYDYYLSFNSENVKCLFDEFISTIENELDSYDIGYWSLYELSENKIKMICSNFYHQLHIVQLDILYDISKKNKFKETSLKWARYSKNKLKKYFSLFHKIIFKVFYY